MKVSRLQRALAFMRAYYGARYRFTRMHGDALQRYQDRRAKRMIQQAINATTYYRERFAGADLHAWRELPVSTRHEVLERFVDANAVGIALSDAMALAEGAGLGDATTQRLNSLTAGLSSGTMGERGVFMLNALEMATWAGFIVARSLPLPPPRGCRVALILRSNSELYQQVDGRWLTFRHFDPRIEAAKLYRALCDFEARYLIGPPSILDALACEHLNTSAALRLERVVSAAEPLEPFVAERVRRAFGCPLGEIYQATEGLIAATCPCGSLHIQEDLMAVQCTRPRWQGVEVSNERLHGRTTLVLTDLYRTTQPVIRQRLDDLVRLSDRPCPCGSAFRVIERVEGRCADACVLPRCDGKLGPVFPGEWQELLGLAFPRLSNFAVQQAGVGALSVFVEGVTPTAMGPGGGMTTAAQRVREALLAKGFRPDRVTVSMGVPAPRPGMKLRRVAGAAVPI